MGTAPWDMAFPEGLWHEGQNVATGPARMRNGAEESVWGTEQGCSRAQRGLTSLKLGEFTKYCSEKLEQEACDFLRLIRAAAALKLGLGSLPARAEIRSRRSTGAFCSFFPDLSGFLCCALKEGQDLNLET